MDLNILMREYGWVGFMVYILLKELWPFFRDRIYPNRLAEEHLIRERRVNMEERALKNEERNIIALESLSLATQQVALALTASNERISTLINDQKDHARFTVDAISDMREKIASGNSVKKEDR